MTWCAVCYEDRDTTREPGGIIACAVCGHEVDRWGVVRAWDLVGYDGEKFIRIVGGTALYETVIAWDGQRSDKVKLARLAADDRGLRTVLRYVDPDTLVELVEPEGGDS